MSLSSQSKQATQIVASQFNETVINILIGLAIVLIMAFHLAFLTQYPSAHIDESWNSNIAWTWLQTGVLFDSIHKGSMDQFGHEWLQHPYLGAIPWIVSFSALGLGLFQARLVSWVFGTILIVATVEVGRQLYSFMVGLMAALLLTLTVPFIRSSHWARQDIILTVLVMAAFGLAYFALEKEKCWVHLLTGLILGLSIDIHENGALFIPSLAALYLVKYRTSILKKPGTWLVASGGILGITYFIVAHVLPDPSTYFTLRSFRFSSDLYAQYQMPVMQLSLWKLLESIDGQIGIYRFYENGVDFIVIGASFVYILYRRRQPDYSLITFIGVTFLCFVLFQGSKENYYAIYLYPFFMLVVAESFISILRSRSGGIGQKLFTGALLLFFLFTSFAHYVKPVFQNQNYSYYGVSEQIKESIQPDDRVLGSPVWWLGMSTYDFSSLENLNFFRFFNNYSLTKTLTVIQPDILIIEPYFRWSIREDQKIYPELEAFLKEHGTKLQDFTDPQHGHIEVYRIEWPLQENTDEQ